MIVFYIVTDINEQVACVDAIHEEEFRAIVKIAELLDLDCMPFVDYVGDTILNQRQLKMLKNEVIKIKSYTNDFTKELDVWLVAINKALENSLYYLLINGE